MVPPVGTFTVADIRYVLTFGIFLMVALFTGKLSTRLRRQIMISRRREARIKALYSLSREITAVSELQPVMQSIVDKIAETVEGQVVLLLPDQEGKLAPNAVSGMEEEVYFNENEKTVAAWVYENGSPAGRGTDTLSAAEGFYLPLSTDQGIKGVLGIRPKHPEQLFFPEQMHMLEAFAGLAAVAVARVQLAEQARESQLLAESERLRTALFSSLSHDLRTPLASVIGAVTGLLEDDGVYSPEDRIELLQNIRQGAMRMNRFVNNLLDMARIESGIVHLKPEWCDIQEIIGVAVGRIEDQLSNRSIKIEVEPDLPLVYMDFVLIEQVLINLLDNALKYSEPGSEILVYAREKEGQLEVSVWDKGQAIPQEDRKRVFEKFYRSSALGSVRGTGLGLAICKGFIEAHRARIWAVPNPDGGEVFIFTLPIDKERPVILPEIE
jgi:two-component system sensor histidine kinase KdpD